MMASCVYVIVGPVGFCWGFVISEVIASLSSIRKGDMHMLNNLCSNMVSYSKYILVDAVASWEPHLTYRPSLLTSL